MVNFEDYVASQERKRRAAIVPSKDKSKMQRRRKKRSLVCGTVKKPIGSNVAITKSRVLKRMSKNDSVLHKHVKWLKDLQEERRKLEEKKEADREQQMERKRLFMEREAKKRAAGKAARDDAEPCAPTSAQDVVEEDPASDDSTVASTIASVASEGKRKKPAWCQSESAREEAEIEEEFDLLEFVEGLDFDQYSQDLELQTLMGQVKQRIKSLERENKKDETKLQTCLDSENAQRRAEALESGPVVDFLPPDVVDVDEGDADDDAKTIANSVMSESTIGSIHSKRSLTALVAKAKERRISAMAPIDEEGGEGEKAVPPPVLSTVTDDDGARMAEKKSINKLAFKNRNPAL